MSETPLMMEKKHAQKRENMKIHITASVCLGIVFILIYKKYKLFF